MGDTFVCAVIRLIVIDPFELWNIIQIEGIDLKFRYFAFTDVPKRRVDLKTMIESWNFSRFLPFFSRIYDSLNLMKSFTYSSFSNSIII